MPLEEDYYEKEWRIIEDIFNDAGGDTPPFIVDRAFDELAEESDRWPDCPPSVLMQNVLNMFEDFADKARSEWSHTVFEAAEGVIETVLICYLQDIFFIKEEDVHDMMHRNIAVPKYFTEAEYEKIKEEYYEEIKTT